MVSPRRIVRRTTPRNVSPAYGLRRAGWPCLPPADVKDAPRSTSVEIGVVARANRAFVAECESAAPVLRPAGWQCDRAKLHARNDLGPGAPQAWFARPQCHPMRAAKSAVFISGGAGEWSEATMSIVPLTSSIPEFLAMSRSSAAAARISPERPAARRLLR